MQYVLFLVTQLDEIFEVCIYIYIYHIDEILQQYRWQQAYEGMTVQKMNICCHELPTNPQNPAPTTNPSHIIIASSQTSGTLGAACQEMLHSAGVAMPRGHAALGASDCPNLQEQHVFCKSHGFSDTLCLGPPNYHTNVFGVLCQNNRPPPKIAAWILEIAPLL